MFAHYSKCFSSSYNNGNKPELVLLLWHQNREFRGHKNQRVKQSPVWYNVGYVQYHSHQLVCSPQDRVVC